MFCLDRKFIFGLITIFILIILAIYFAASLNVNSVSKNEIIPVVNNTFMNKNTNTTEIINNKLVFHDYKQSTPEGQEIIFYSNPDIKEIKYSSKGKIDVIVNVNKTIYITKSDIQFQRLDEFTPMTTGLRSNNTGNYTQMLIIKEKTIETWILVLQKQNGTWILISSNKK